LRFLEGPPEQLFGSLVLPASGGGSPAPWASLHSRCLDFKILAFSLCFPFRRFFGATNPLPCAFSGQLLSRGRLSSPPPLLNSIQRLAGFFFLLFAIPSHFFVVEWEAAYICPCARGFPNSYLCECFFLDPVFLARRSPGSPFSKAPMMGSCLKFLPSSRGVLVFPILDFHFSRSPFQRFFFTSFLPQPPLPFNCNTQQACSRGNVVPFLREVSFCRLFFSPNVGYPSLLPLF